MCPGKARGGCDASGVVLAAAREARFEPEGGGREVRGGGADQCLDGSQYLKNSERVGRCWLGCWRGDGEDEGWVMLVAQCFGTTSD